MADPLEGYWEDDILPLLQKDSALQAVTLLRHLQGLHPLALPDDRVWRIRHFGRFPPFALQK